ncbi:MAG: argininosuccinate lyase [Thermodesulfobacteriota bacterium]|nr:argininosuccinate lyase [Thermodesulfobacteriota bacterium]
MADKPWDGRFSQPTDKRVEKFTASVDVDKRLYRQDIDGSIAHCRMLAKQGVIDTEDADAIVAGLEGIGREIEAGTFEFDDALEDVHMNIESALFDRIGPAARKLHTARSRNDQIALDTRMYLRAVSQDIIQGLAALRKCITAFARAHIDVIMPGYTHLQRAQPVLFAHHLMAYYEMFTRDAERFKDGFKRINVMPLGSAALAGTPYPIDRAHTAALLKFDTISANSMDAVSDRDFVLEFIAAASICMVHFSRLCEELIIWSSSEFNFIELSDAFSTGSSIMPQKKNPDVPELIRGKTGRVFGNLTAMLTIMKSLPLCYNRDMQEDKEPLFDTVDTLTACIDICREMIGNIKVNTDVMRNAALAGYLNATDMADYLVEKGMAFRDAHACVGKAVGYAVKKGKELHELQLDELKQFADVFAADVFDVLKPEQMVERRNAFGGTAEANVAAAIKSAEADMKSEAADNEV